MTKLQNIPPCKKCPNAEIFLTRIFPSSVKKRENTEQKKLHIWTFFCTVIPSLDVWQNSEYASTPLAENTPCVKSDQTRSFFWSVFSRIQSKYGKIRTRKYPVFGHFSCSDCNLITWFPHLEITLLRFVNFCHCSVSGLEY